MNHIPSFEVSHLRGVSASQLLLVKISVSSVYISCKKYYESVDPATKAREKIYM